MSKDAALYPQEKDLVGAIVAAPEISRGRVIENNRNMPTQRPEVGWIDDGGMGGCMNGWMGGWVDR